MIWNKILPKYAIEMCQIMRIGQIVVLRDLFKHSAYSTCAKTFTKFQGILEFSVCLF